MNTTHFLGWFLNKQQAPSYIINHRCKWEIIDADQKQRLLPTPGRHHVAFKARAEKKKKLGPHSNAPRHHICFLGPGFVVCVFLPLRCCRCCRAGVCSAARDRHQTAGAVTKSPAVISSFSPFGFRPPLALLATMFHFCGGAAPCGERPDTTALCQRRKLARRRPEILFLTF